MSVFKYEKDGEGIVTVTMDMTGPVNAINDEYRQAMAETVDKLEAEEGLKGVVIASAKKVFFAGGDLNYLYNMTPDRTEEMFRDTEATKHQLRRLEKLPVPVVAAINGAALGGGLELCLASNHRVAYNHPSVLLGLPEVTLGLMPGAGGIVRMVGLIGLEAALPYLLEGKSFDPAHGLSIGLIDELVDDIDALVPRAKDYIRSATDVEEAASQPWDRRGFKIPGGNAKSPAVAQLITLSPAMVRKRTQGSLPAPEEILDCAVSAARLDFDTASRIESRGITRLVMTPQAKNMIKAFFFQANRIKGGKHRPTDQPKFTVKSLGIVGSGESALDLAYAAAMAGVETLYVDSAGDLQGYLDAKLSSGGVGDEHRRSMRERLRQIPDEQALKDCDLVIRSAAGGTADTGEAPGFRGTVSTPGVGDDPTTNVGLLTLEPPGRSNLVELSAGAQTSPEHLARAYDFVRQLKKTPIVVHREKGSLLARVFTARLEEGIRLLLDGAHPAVIDNLAVSMGMVPGPLALADGVGLTLLQQTLSDWSEAGLLSSNQLDAAVGSLLKEVSAERNTFFDYDDDGAKQPGSLLMERYHKTDLSFDRKEIQDRLLFRPVIETLRCLEDVVIDSVTEANIASLYGIGAPTWTGGYAQFVNTYGMSEFINRCDQLASRFGERFSAPDIVNQKQQSQESFD